MQVLYDKLQETGSQKGILVSTSGFQRGAIEYAKRKGIALIRILRGEMLFETKSHFEPKVNLEQLKRNYGLPDYSFQKVEGLSDEESVSVTLLEDDHLNEFFTELKKML